MGMHRTLCNEQRRHLGAGRFSRKSTRKGTPFHHVSMDGIKFGNLTMTHATKGKRQRNMSDKIQNLIVLSTKTEAQALEKMVEFWRLWFHDAQLQMTERRYPLV